MDSKKKMEKVKERRMRSKSTKKRIVRGRGIRRRKPPRSYGLVGIEVFPEHLSAVTIINSA